MMMKCLLFMKKKANFLFIQQSNTSLINNAIETAEWDSQYLQWLHQFAQTKKYFSFIDKTNAILF